MKHLVGLILLLTPLGDPAALAQALDGVATGGVAVDYASARAFRIL